MNTYTAPITSGEGTSPEPAPEPDAIYVTLTGTKILEGATLKDGQFRFVVYNEWGHEIGYGTNTADGKIKFDPIPVSAEGTHIWTIKEVNNGEMSIVYDTNKIQVKVDVVELEDTYEATVHYPKSGIVFTNKTSGYIAPLTGDDAPIGLYLGILAVVVAALAGLLIWRKKKEQQDN